MSNNVVCATSKGSDQRAHTHSLIRAFATHLTVKLQTEHHSVMFLRLKRGYMPHCCKSHVVANMIEVLTKASEGTNKKISYIECSKEPRRFL